MTSSTRQTSLSMVMISQEAWESLTNEIKAIRDELRSKSEEEMKKQWIESTEARKMLGVSPKTWQNYRDNRVLPFVQFGRKIYVKKGDIDTFMESHYVSI